MPCEKLLSNFVEVKRSLPDLSKILDPSLTLWMTKKNNQANERRAMTQNLGNNLRTGGVIYPFLTS